MKLCAPRAEVGSEFQVAALPKPNLEPRKIASIQQERDLGKIVMSGGGCLNFVFNSGELPSIYNRI